MRLWETRKRRIRLRHFARPSFDGLWSQVQHPVLLRAKMLIFKVLLTLGLWRPDEDEDTLTFDHCRSKCEGTQNSSDSSSKGTLVWTTDIPRWLINVSQRGITSTLRTMNQVAVSHNHDQKELKIQG